MDHEKKIEGRITRYLEMVAANIGGVPADEQEEILRNVESHIYEALSERAGENPTIADVEAVLAEMDPPETYAETLTPEHEKQKPSIQLVILALLCSCIQIVGLGMVVYGVPVVGAIVGFASVVSFFIVWSNQQSPKWLIRLTGVAAICGLGMIILEITRTL